ncbi:MAG: hypothetical protein LQ344_002809 [Seirophora lacunosa]|nr:MAG: hypothetical protein LQ344_002809 [Seirophora lacunosa]
MQREARDIYEEWTKDADQAGKRRVRTFEDIEATFDEMDKFIRQIKKGKLPSSNAPTAQQVKEIERVYGTTFENCRAYFRESFQKWFCDIWWKDVQTNYGPEFIAQSGQSEKMLLVQQGICLFLTRWFSAADYDEAIPSVSGPSLEQKSQLRAVVKLERALLHGGRKFGKEETFGIGTGERAKAVSAKFLSVIMEVLKPVVSSIVDMKALELNLSHWV